MLTVLCQIILKVTHLLMGWRDGKARAASFMPHFAAR